ncbi:unnamed protein product, partial [Timema podura]|nr:unnamed protein product [Timema podura]
MMGDECDSDGVTDSPKKGPTLSTSTSSFEALDPHDPNLSRLASTMFQKTADYLFGELVCTQTVHTFQSCHRLYTPSRSDWSECSITCPDGLKDFVGDRRLGYKSRLSEEYKLLESMNRATITKYADMKQVAGNVARTVADLNDKC